MSMTDGREAGSVDSAAVASSRRRVEQALSELERSWVNPRPDAVITAARRYLAAVENWADSRREGA
ncbi:hypothetical protein [Arthrobacter sp. Br18]|uniref:hypothetical protein n=1 Tax=Arthrobacter sp. Br18 TaxID=1312954 RepID=UPI001C1E6DC1|nr:hypothetical protein [Arthrobacter sp. Br18]